MSSIKDVRFVMTGFRKSFQCELHHCNIELMSEPEKIWDHRSTNYSMTQTYSEIVYWQNLTKTRSIV